MNSVGQMFCFMQCLVDCCYSEGNDLLSEFFKGFSGDEPGQENQTSALVNRNSMKNHTIQIALISTMIERLLFLGVPVQTIPVTGLSLTEKEVSTI